MDRLATANGPLYVWFPPGSSRDAAVVYVHGFYDSAASAIRDHHLQEQFAASGLKVPFLVPEAPQGKGEPVRFPSLPQLLGYAGLPLNTPVIAVAHSGGYRTVANWLGTPSLKHIILLDAAYGNLPQFTAWGQQPGHSMALVGQDTAQASKTLAARVKAPYYDGQTHMGIVISEGWIAKLLKAAPVLALANLRAMGIAVAIAAAGYAAWRLW